MEVHEIDGRVVAGRACSGGRDLGVVSITIRKGKISSIEPGLRRGALVVEGSFWIAPGLIDLQVNGGFGVDLLQNPGELGHLSARLPSTGVLCFLPTLASPSAGVACELAQTVLDNDGFRRVDPASGPSAEALGVHLEGPLLNPARAGAHPPERLLTAGPALEHFERVTAIGGLQQRGVVRMVTLAPELEGAFDLVAAAARHRVVTAAGHTDADYEQGLSAIRHGIRVLTHIFNACRPIHHRDPGILAAYLMSPDAYATLICDGVHVLEPIVKMATVLAGPGRIALVTDAVSDLGATTAKSAAVDPAAATDPTGRPTGGTTPLAACAANFARFGEIDFPRAIHSASGVPARILGLRYGGDLETGTPASFIALSEEGEVAAVAQGSYLFELQSGAVGGPRRKSR